MCVVVSPQLGYGSTTEDIGDEVGEMSTVGFVDLGVGRKADRVEAGQLFTGMILYSAMQLLVNLGAPKQVICLIPHVTVVLLSHDGVDGGRLMSWGRNQNGQVRGQMHMHL